MRDDLARLLDIQDAIEQIEKYAVRGRAAFEEDPLIQVWILHHVQVIGEAARNLSASFRLRHPEVDWSEIVGTRNVLVHHYFGIDKDAVWRVVEQDLPELKRRATAILQAEQDRR